MVPQKEIHRPEKKSVKFLEWSHIVLMKAIELLSCKNIAQTKDFLQSIKPYVQVKNGAKSSKSIKGRG